VVEVVIVRSYADDLEGLYVDGKLKDTDSSISIDSVVYYTKGLPCHISIYDNVPGLDIYLEEHKFMFPKKLETVLDMMDDQDI